MVIKGSLSGRCIIRGNRLRVYHIYGTFYIFFNYLNEVYQINRENSSLKKKILESESRIGIMRYPPHGDRLTVGRKSTLGRVTAKESQTTLTPSGFYSTSAGLLLRTYKGRSANRFWMGRWEKIHLRPSHCERIPAARTYKRTIG